MFNLSQLNGLNLGQSTQTPTQATVLELLKTFAPLPPMAEPLVLANLPSDAELADAARQIATQTGPIWEAIKAGCERVMAAHENTITQ